MSADVPVGSSAQCGMCVCVGWRRSGLGSQLSTSECSCFNKNCELAAFRVGLQTARTGLGEDRAHCRDFPVSQRMTLCFCLSVVAAKVSLLGIVEETTEDWKG